jgi:hypothetical protein
MTEGYIVTSPKINRNDGFNECTTGATCGGSENHNVGGQSAFCSFQMPSESWAEYKARVKAWNEARAKENDVYADFNKLKRDARIAFATYLTLSTLGLIASIVCAVCLLSI